MRFSWITAFGLTAIFPAMAVAQGVPSANQADPWTLCRTAIRGAERATGGVIPAQLLGSIAMVESGRRRAATGGAEPWPWTINAEGVGSFYETKAAAIAAVLALQARDVRSIDVGCMQINLMHHPDAFASLEQAFDPQANANYGARFLSQLHNQTGDWIAAAGMYHSATPTLAADYRRLVLAVWPGAKGGVETPTRLAVAWRSMLPAEQAAGGGRGYFIPMAWDTPNRVPTTARIVASAAPPRKTRLTSVR